MNPTDAYRKRQRKKEVQKNKKERKKVREFSAMVRNPDLMVEEVRTENDDLAYYYLTTTTVVVCVIQLSVVPS